MSTRRGPVGDVVDTSRHRALAAASRVHLLELVRSAGNGLTAAEATKASGLHPSTVRAHLDQLTTSGLLTRERVRDGSPGRPAWRYRAVAQPESEADRPYRDLASALIGHIGRSENDPYAAGVRAGRDWGRTLAARLGQVDPIDGLVQVLGGLRFTPTVAARRGARSAVIHLRTCPFLPLAQASPDVVCGVHLGLISGALSVLGASGVETSLEPFALPGACVVRVRAHRRDLRDEVGQSEEVRELHSGSNSRRKPRPLAG